MSRIFCVTVWVGDAHIPAAEYMRKCIGKTSTVHDRLTRNAMRKFPNWSRIEVNGVQS